MKFRAKQFCSGYMYFSFESKDQTEADHLIRLYNEGEDPDVIGLELKQESFDADDGGEMRLVK